MKLSEFLLKIVKACRKIDRRTYRPLYDHWHYPLNAMERNLFEAHTPPCFVCLAGAWVASKKHSKATERYNPHSPYKHPEEGVTPDEMLALEYIRKGQWRTAAATLGISPSPPPKKYASKHQYFRDWPDFLKFLNYIETEALALKSRGY